MGAINRCLGFLYYLDIMIYYPRKDVACYISRIAMIFTGKIFLINTMHAYCHANYDFLSDKGINAPYRRNALRLPLYTFL